ncbi:hypothetical protein [Litorilituus sediminis]|uniref:hypothetical protein n=1 Tax=Litorilituus sediminis TaxID=718192 RepID=UPI001B88555D|nr:hypothetical protein [Litorilituus sediminis]
MKILPLLAINLLLAMLAINPLTSYASASTQNSDNSLDRDAWLKMRFSKQHEELIPVVAVADMFFSCNRARKTDEQNYQLKDLVQKMDKGELAEKLADCLGEDNMQSEAALNFGLLGCFHDQLAHLPEQEKKQKMKLVKQAIASLSRSERQRSFTQCVTEQSIHYLK